MIGFGVPTALIGGSFDPVHAGHIHLALEIRRLAPDIQQVIFVPAAHSPGKQPVSAPAEARLRWLRAAAEPAGFAVWDWELGQGGESYTVNTVTEAHRLGARPENLYWVMGADAYATFPRWREPGRIRELCRLLVINRPGYALEPLAPEDRVLTIAPHPASSRAIRALLQAGNLAGAEAAGLLPGLRAELEKICREENPYARRWE